MPDKLKNLRQAKRAVRKGMTPDEAGVEGLGYGEDYDKLLKSRAYKKQRASEAGYKNVRQARKAAKANDGFLPNSPYMLYGKKSDIMMGGSPLAKYGCSKKYKKSK